MSSEYIGEDIKAVLCDWDDTLVGTIEAKWAQHKHVARTWYNKDLLDEELRPHWGKPLNELIGLLYETQDIDLALTRIRTIHDQFPKRLFDETLGVLERCRALGKLVGVVTAHSREGLTYDFQTLGIPHELFDYTQTLESTAVHKPNPHVFDPAITWLASRNIEPYQTVYVGDSLLDMRAAQGAGLQFIGVETGLNSLEQFRSLGTPAVRNLTELLPLA